MKATVVSNPFFRAIAITAMNLLFYSKTIKAWFEKQIFNPYEIDGNKRADYALAQMDKIAEHLDVAGKTILEIGPGGNYYLACALLKNGARKVFVIDNENHSFFSKQELAIYTSLYPESIGDDQTINQDKIAVLHYGRNGTIPLSDDSIDIVYSNAVLEHVFAPEKLLQECQRMLRSGGKMMHQIDYRDHIFSQKSLFFLRIPDILFDLLFHNTGMWVNRLRHSQWVHLFQSLEQMKITRAKQSADIVSAPKSGKLTKEDAETTSALFIVEKYAQ